jgi:hypothetical protein
VIGQQQTFLAKYADEIQRAAQGREEPEPVRLYQSGFLLNPQKGFHVFTEPMVDAYCNNPKMMEWQSPRGVRRRWETGRRLAPILTVPLDSKTPNTTRLGRNRRAGHLRTTV